MDIPPLPPRLLPLPGCRLTALFLVESIVVAMRLKLRNNRGLRGRRENDNMEEACLCHEHAENSLQAVVNSILGDD